MTSQYEELKHLKKAREHDQCNHSEKIQKLQKQVELTEIDLENYNSLQKEFKLHQQNA